MRQVAAEEDSRYIRQMSLPQIGAEGQQRLYAARVAVVGIGALGSVSAELMARAGVGYLRLIDRDYVSLNNLHRTALFSEADAADNAPKAVAASKALQAVNSGIQLEAAVTHLSGANALELLQDMDLVLDGSDNYELRYLLNEACDQMGIPWVYAGAVGNFGMVMPIIPGQTACFRCLAPTPPPPGSYPTCASSGILGSVSSSVASIQATEAIKLLLGRTDNRLPGLLSIDAWNCSFDVIEVQRDATCPVCGQHQYEQLGHDSGATSSALCGRDEYQVLPAAPADLDLSAWAQRLRSQGDVLVSPYILTFSDTKVRFKLFADGRMMLKGAQSADQALAIYSEYLGL
jgi:adenylyltransferase/sulfurtransferase